MQKMHNRLITYFYTAVMNPARSVVGLGAMARFEGKGKGF